MKKRITIKDIAKKAGVSTGTVDRVLHNRGHVKPAVKKIVLEVIKELGYERNLIASALAYNRTVRIAAILPDPNSDPYWAQVRVGVKKASKAVKHYGIVVESSYFDLFNPENFKDIAREKIETKPDAILFPPMFLHEAQWLLGECERLEIPNVMINTNIEDAKSLCYIGQDSYQSGVLGARLLNFGLNNNQTVCILNLDFITKAAHHLHKKEQGFRDYFKENGNKEIEIIRKDFEEFDNKVKLTNFLNTLLTDYPNLSGIFVTNSRAYKVVNCLNDTPGRKIKIVGFDLIDQNLEYLMQNKINFLINQNPVEQGFQGVVSLFNHLILEEPVEKLQYLPLDIVVEENVMYYLKKQKGFKKIIG